MAVDTISTENVGMFKSVETQCKPKALTTA
jgi:hypothetical protein